MSSVSRRSPTRVSSPAVALLVHALRSCLPPRRLGAVLFPCVGAVVFGLLAVAVSDSPDRAFVRVATTGIFGIAVPVAALVIGDAVLGAEIRAGTFHFTWLSPVSARLIIVTRWAAGTMVALVTIVPATAVAALVAGSPSNALPAALAAAVGASSYVALFIAVGAVTRRSTVWSLAIVFFVERLLGSALTGIAQISPTWESRAVFLSFANDVPTSLVRTGIPEGTSAIVRLAVISVVLLGVASWRLGHLRLSGASD